MSREKPSPLLRPLSSFRAMYDVPTMRLGSTNRVYIHCCKDGTCSFRQEGEPVFNGVALAVYAVASIEEARQLQVLMCFRVVRSHPAMKRGEPWYKFNDVRNSPHISDQPSLDPNDDPEFRRPVFDIDDLPKLSAKIHAVYRAHVAPKKRAMSNV